MEILKVPEEPCYKDCLVRATCIYIERFPWERINKCEIYQKHREKELRIMKINGFFSSTYEFCISLTIIAVFFGAPFCLMGLGIWKAWELAKPLIERILS